MSLNAIQLYVKGLLDGMPVEGFPSQVALTAYVEPPPSVQTGDGPVCYVWGSEGDEQRKTLARYSADNPGATGFKSAFHTLDLIVQWSCEQGSEYEQLFPLVIDAIRKVLRQTDLRVVVTDPTTGEQSQVTDLGERIRWQYGVPVATSPESQLMRLNRALIRLPFHEWAME